MHLYMSIKQHLSWPEAWWRETFPALLLGPVSDNLGVDSAAHTVLQLCIQFREGISCKSFFFFFFFFWGGGGGGGGGRGGGGGGK